MRVKSTRTIARLHFLFTRRDALWVRAARWTACVPDLAIMARVIFWSRIFPRPGSQFSDYRHNIDLDISIQDPYFFPELWHYPVLKCRVWHLRFENCFAGAAAYLAPSVSSFNCTFISYYKALSFIQKRQHSYKNMQIKKTKRNFHQRNLKNLKE